MFAPVRERKTCVLCEKRLKPTDRNKTTEPALRANLIVFLKGTSGGVRDGGICKTCHARVRKADRSKTQVGWSFKKRKGDKMFDVNVPDQAVISQDAPNSQDQEFIHQVQAILSQEPSTSRQAEIRHRLLTSDRVSAVRTSEDSSSGTSQMVFSDSMYSEESVVQNISQEEPQIVPDSQLEESTQESTPSTASSSSTALMIIPISTLQQTFLSLN